MVAVILAVSIDVDSAFLYFRTDYLKPSKKTNIIRDGLLGGNENLYGTVEVLSGIGCYASCDIAQYGQGLQKSRSSGKKEKSYGEIEKDTGKGDKNTGVGNPVDVAGKGSTGRNVPNSLNDLRWPTKNGWVKMCNNVAGTEIHFLYNTITGAFDGFKFKD